MRWLAWIPVIGFAIAVYLLTSDPVLGAILPCLLAGRRAIESAIWLHAVDSVRPRRRANQAFLIALGCWLAVMTAFLSMMGFGIVAAFTGRDPDMRRVIATIYILLFGLALCSLFALIAAIYAWYHRVKVWPHPNLRQLADGNFDQLASLPHVRHGFHYGLFVLGTAIAAPTATTGVILMAIVMQALRLESVAVVLGCLLGTCLAGVLAYGILSDRILARSPAECWTNVPNPLNIEA
jgi:hypothetical protein